MRVPIEEVIPLIDRTLSGIVMKAIAPMLDERFATASDFRAALFAWARAADQREKFLAEFLDRAGHTSAVPKPMLPCTWKA